MRIRRWPSVLAAVFVLAVFPALAADGAIPIWEPTTISNPGTYVVTRNITSPDTIIEITSDDVRLDLNGHTLEHTNPSSDSAAVVVQPSSNVVIERGQIRSAGIGIRTNGGPLVSFVVRDTTLVCQDIVIWAANGLRQTVIERNRGTGNMSFQDCVGCRIGNNELQGGLDADDEFYDSVIHGNIFKCEECAFSGILMNGDHNVITGNTVTGCGGISVSGKAVVIDNNVVTSCLTVGIVLAVWGDNNVVRSNTVRGSSTTGAQVGLGVYGQQNRILGNAISNSNVGLLLEARSAECLYEGNLARGNGTDFIDDGTNNTSHGDNYMPGQM